MDPWDSEELTAARHIGTVCAGAVALLAVLAGAKGPIAGSAVLLRIATMMLLFGVAGSGIYQLITIHVRGRTMTALRIVGAMMMVVGLLGFVVLACSIVLVAV